LKKKPKYNSLTGGVFTILLFFLSICASFFFGKELYLKQDPTVILSNFFENDPAPFNLTKNNLNFFIGIQNTDFNYYIDPTIYTIKISFNQITTSKKPDGKVEFSYKFNRVLMEKCNLTKHFQNFQDLFNEDDLENLSCFDQDKMENITLAGSFGKKNFQYLEFSVSSCKNDTDSNIICKPKEEIDKKLKGGFFIVNYVETIFDPKNFSYPNIYIKRDFYTSMSNKYFKEITFNLKNIDYISDAGILISSEETKNFVQTDNIKEIYDFREADTFISTAFRLSYNKDIIKRRYLKLQDVVAQIGGFIKGISIILVIINYYYSSVNYYIFLMNKLYFFDLNDIYLRKQSSKAQILNKNISQFDYFGKQNNIEYNKKKNIHNYEVNSNDNNNIHKSQNIIQNTELKYINDDVGSYNDKYIKKNLNIFKDERILNSINAEKTSQIIFNSNNKNMVCGNLNEEKSNMEEKFYIVEKLNMKEKINVIENNNVVNINNNRLDNNNRYVSDPKINNTEIVLKKKNMTLEIKYDLYEKFFLMFNLCFNFCKHNDKDKKFSSRQRKKIVFENSYDQIKNNFDVINYLKISDDLKLIKFLIFTEYQIDLIELINRSKNKYANFETYNYNENINSLKKLENSENPFDKKIKFALKNCDLI